MKKVFVKNLWDSFYPDYGDQSRQSRKAFSTAYKTNIHKMCWPECGNQPHINKSAYWPGISMYIINVFDTLWSHWWKMEEKAILELENRSRGKYESNSILHFILKKITELKCKNNITKHLKQHK